MSWYKSHGGFYLFPFIPPVRRDISDWIYILVVLPMSTSWTPMLSSGFNPDFTCGSMRLGCLVTGGLWNFPTVKLGKSRYRLYWVESTNKPTIKFVFIYKDFLKQISWRRKTDHWKIEDDQYCQTVASLTSNYSYLFILIPSAEAFFGCYLLFSITLSDTSK